MKNLFLDFLLLINAMQAIHNLLLVRVYISKSIDD